MKGEGRGERRREEEEEGRKKKGREGERAHGRVWLNLVLCCRGRDALSALCKGHGCTA